ncbi:MAG TPA: DoxX family protein [Casimicrobiaceae bacterium]|nr:DoxX family protein [Casimicrobiaceae bacterium]
MSTLNDLSHDFRPSQATHDGVALVGRILLAVLFIWSGFGKLTGFEGVVGGIAAKGLPMPTILAAIAVAIELGGGILLALGWRTRWVALAMALFLIVITPIYHDFWNATGAAVTGQKVNFMKNLCILGGMLMVFALGPGRYSLDRG